MDKLVVAIVVFLAFGKALGDFTPVDFIENVNQKAAPSRIVSGWLAHPGQHPHQVALRVVYPGGLVSGCGGSVVHRRWVITAAHCTATAYTLVVRAGVTSLTRPQYIWETSVWYNHPAYDSQQPGLVQPHDVSIVNLRRPFVYTEFLRPIRLQSSADAYRDYSGEVAHASGFGRTWTEGSATEDLNWVYMTVISNANCLATFGSAYIVQSSICARFYNVTSQSICQGDSGGPLVLASRDGVPTLVGISSFVAGGSLGCHSGYPAGFVRPGPYLSWLQQVTGIDFENLIEEEETTLAPTTTEQPTTIILEPTTTEEVNTTIAPTTTQEPSSTTTEPTTTQEPTSTTREPTTIEAPNTTEETITTEEPIPDESEEDSSDSSEEEELAELLKRLEVKVKVNVKLNKYKKKHVVHEIHEVPA